MRVSGLEIHHTSVNIVLSNFFRVYITERIDFCPHFWRELGEKLPAELAVAPDRERVQLLQHGHLDVPHSVAHYDVSRDPEASFPTPSNMKRSLKQMAGHG